MSNHAWRLNEAFNPLLNVFETFVAGAISPLFIAESLICSGIAD